MTYQQYAFQGDKLPDEFPAVAGYPWDVSGQPSSVTEVSVGPRFNTLGSGTNLFFSIRTGLHLTHLGEIIISTSSDSGTYKGSGVSETRPFAGMGAGLSAPLNPAVRLRLEVSYIETFDSQESYIPLISTLQFDL